jgi:uncharacterized protein (DUF1778 family)
MKRGRPPKAPEERKADRLDIRVNAEEKAAFQDAAARSEQSLSKWVRTRLIAAAKRENAA